MLVANLRQPFLALDKIRNEIHRPRPKERDQRDDVIELLHIELLRNTRHAAGLHLEKPDRFAAIVERKRGRIIERNIFQRKIGDAFSDQGDRVLDHRERLEPKKVHLEQSEVVERPHRILADDIVAFDVAAERHVIGEVAIGDYDAGRMHAGVARKSFQQRRMIPKLPRGGLRLNRAFKFGIFFRGGIECDVQLVRNHFRDPIGIAITQTDDAPNIAHHAFRFQFSKRDDLRNTAFAIFLTNVFEHFAPARLAKIDINIGRRNALGIKETLEDQAELQRIDVGDSEHVSDQRTGGRPPARADWNSALLGEMNEIPNDEQITDKAGFLEDIELVIEPLDQFTLDLVAEALVQSGIAKFAQINFARFVRRRRILRVFRFSKFQLEIATLRDLDRVRDCLRMIRKKSAHLVRRLKI